MAVIETPCIKVCTIHAASRLCLGCGRTLDEIARWVDYTDRERAEIMSKLPARLAALTPQSGAA
jgi:predicted Fe-S protein YdhL (DUF1289 family)